MEKYLAYLKKCANLYKVSLYTAHQYKLSREVALEYGVTKQEIANLDSTLKSTD